MKTTSFTFAENYLGHYWDIPLFVYIFAMYSNTNIKTIYKTSKEMERNAETAIREFYQNLTRKEKGDFLDFLHSNYGLKHTTLQQKLCRRPNSPLRPMEIRVIYEIINNNEWR